MYFKYLNIIIVKNNEFTRPEKLFSLHKEHLLK